MAFGERLRRLDDRVVGKPGQVSGLPTWLHRLRYAAVAVGLLAIVLLDQPWSTLVLVVLLAVVWSLHFRYRRLSRRTAARE